MKFKFSILLFLISFLIGPNVFGVEPFPYGAACGPTVASSGPTGGGGGVADNGAGSGGGSGGNGGESNPPPISRVSGSGSSGSGGGNKIILPIVVGGVVLAGYGVYKLVKWGNRKHEFEGTVESGHWEHKKELRTYLPTEKEGVFTDDEIEKINQDLIHNKFILDLSKEDQSRRISRLTPFDKTVVGKRTIQEKVTKKIIDKDTGEEKVVEETIQKEVDDVRWKCRYVEFDWAIENPNAHVKHAQGGLDTPITWPHLQKDSGQYPQKIVTTAKYTLNIKFYKDNEVKIQDLSMLNETEFSRWKDGEAVNVIYSKFKGVEGIQKKK